MSTSEPPDSPTPAPPTAQTPGPRASAFVKLYNDALSNTLKSISYESFAACFPLIAVQAPDSLRAMHGAFVGRLEGFAKVFYVLVETQILETGGKRQAALAGSHFKL